MFDPYAIDPFARPIANHSSSIIALASKIIRPLLTPIISNHPLLCDDVNSVITQLSLYGPPGNIYHYDIKAFYPSIHHVLAQLLSYNFLISGDTYYHLGPIGIPMGLPLAPEIARVVTAFQLDIDLQIAPPVALSLYFDNLYTTHPPEDILPVFAPFIFTDEPFNTFQDAAYYAELQELSKSYSAQYPHPHPPPLLSPPQTHGIKIISFYHS